MENITFLHPEFFWLFGLLPLLVLWYFWTRNKRRASLTLSAKSGFGQSSPLNYGVHILFVLRVLSLSAMIVGLARPQSMDVSNRLKTSRGIDIVMAVDVSGSMLARDLKPDRLEALKMVAQDFVDQRPNDRIGLVLYSAESYTKVPVTSDHRLVRQAIREVKYDNTLKDGTAIGMGLSTAVNRLKDSDAKSKVIILLTDGVNNAGFVAPITAAEVAREYGIKVYTIGIGTNGMAESPYAYAPNGGFLFRKMPVEIDEKLMKDIAKLTDGKYFRATDNETLKKIYDEINQLETSEIEELRYYHYDEKYRPLLLLAGLLLLFEFLLRQTLFRGIV